jgi:hypothetical protein
MGMDMGMDVTVTVNALVVTLPSAALQLLIKVAMWRTLSS